MNLRQQAAAIRGNQEFVGPSQKAVARIPGECPRKWFIDPQIERHAQVGVEMPLDAEVSAVRNREVEFAGSDLCHQVCYFDVRILLPLEFGIVLA